MIGTMFLICISLVTIKSEHLFMCLFVICICTFLKWLFMVFAHFVTGCFSLTAEFWDFLKYPKSQSIVSLCLWFANIFSLFVVLFSQQYFQYSKILHFWWPKICCSFSLCIIHLYPICGFLYIVWHLQVHTEASLYVLIILTSEETHWCWTQNLERTWDPELPQEMLPFITHVECHLS